MENEPEQIYLQVGDEVEETDFDELTGVSWCVDKVNKNDIQYCNTRSIFEKMLSKSKETISGALRVEFVSVADIKNIFEQYGIKEEPKF